MAVPPSVKVKRAEAGYYHVSYRGREARCVQHQQGDAWPGYWFCDHQMGQTKAEAIELWYKQVRAGEEAAAADQPARSGPPRYKPQAKPQPSPPAEKPERSKVKSKKIEPGSYHLTCGTYACTIWNNDVAGGWCVNAGHGKDAINDQGVFKTKKALIGAWGAWVQKQAAPAAAESPSESGQPAGADPTPPEAGAEVSPEVKTITRVLREARRLGIDLRTNPWWDAMQVVHENDPDTHAELLLRSPDDE